MHDSPATTTPAPFTELEATKLQLFVANITLAQSALTALHRERQAYIDNVVMAARPGFTWKEDQNGVQLVKIETEADLAKRGLKIVHDPSGKHKPVKVAVAPAPEKMVQKT